MAPEKFAFPLGERFTMGIGDGDEPFTVIARDHTSRGNLYWLRVMENDPEAVEHSGATYIVEEAELEACRQFDQLMADLKKRA